jgi:hypothetical protein
MGRVCESSDYQEGQAITKVVAAYYGIPDYVVNFSTENVWKPQLQHKDEGNEHHGILRAPVGYEICYVERKSEVSISGRSSLTVSIWRNDQNHGLGWYADVPEAERFKGGEYVNVLYTVSFVKAEPAVWNKYKDKCSPSNYEMPGVYNIDECKGPNNCKAPLHTSINSQS